MIFSNVCAGMLMLAYTYVGVKSARMGRDKLWITLLCAMLFLSCASLCLYSIYYYRWLNAQI